MLYDPDKKLNSYLLSAERKYGKRYGDFRIRPVQFREAKYAQTKVDETEKTIEVWLTTPARTNIYEAFFQLGHEVVHVLTPVAKLDTLRFEEGLAVYFSLYHAGLTGSRRQQYRDSLPTPWSESLADFENLQPTESKIKALRDTQPCLDLVNPQLLQTIFQAPEDLAAKLCNRFPGTRD